MTSESPKDAERFDDPGASGSISDRRDARPRAMQSTGRDNGRLLDLRAAEAYSGISAWTLRDLIASGHLVAVRPPGLRRVWIDRHDLDQAIARWKDRGASAL